jgi:hypothetical protein
VLSAALTLDPWNCPRIRLNAAFNLCLGCQALSVHPAKP